MNSHIIHVTFLGPTNSRGSRVKLSGKRHDADNVTLNYDHAKGNTLEQACEWLRERGYTVLAYGDSGTFYTIAVMEFVALQEARKSTPADGAVESWKAGHGRYIFSRKQIREGTGRNGCGFSPNARFVQLEA